MSGAARRRRRSARSARGTPRPVLSPTTRARRRRSRPRPSTPTDCDRFPEKTETALPRATPVEPGPTRTLRSRPMDRANGDPLAIPVTRHGRRATRECRTRPPAYESRQESAARKARRGDRSVAHRSCLPETVALPDRFRDSRFDRRVRRTHRPARDTRGIPTAARATTAAPSTRE